VLGAARWKCRTQKIAKKSPSGHHRTTLSGYIFAIKAPIDHRKKNLLSSDMSSVVTVSKCFLSVGFGRFCRKNLGFRFGLGFCDKRIVNLD